MNKLAGERAPLQQLSDQQKYLAGFKTMRRQSQAVLQELRTFDESGVQQLSADTNAKCAAVGFTLEHLGVTIGTVIHGVDLSARIGADAIEAIRSVLLERKVVFFRKQTLTVEQHKAFTKRFGSLEVHPFSGKLSGHEEVLVIEHGAGSPGTENNWHSDVTWRAAPSLGSVLYCRHSAPFGGDTLFSDANAMFNGLHEDLQRSLLGQYAIHDFSLFRAAQLKSGVSLQTIDELRRSFPIARHPIVRTHPETGKQSLYVNVAFTRYIEGMERKDSDQLLQELYREAAHPEYQCRFRWESGSVAFWDNRQCQHLASSDYYPMERSMHRVTVQGDTPFYRNSAEKLRSKI